MTPIARGRGSYRMHTSYKVKKISRVLAELKFIRCCPSRYPGTNGRTAVATRASKIQSEYDKKATDAEEAFGMPQGRLLMALHSYGPITPWVLGAYGEANEGIHTYIEDLANLKTRKAALEHDRNPLGMKGQIKSQLRRAVGVHVARANADVGINRLKYIGTGGAMALARRNERLAQRRAEEEERRAHHEASFALVHPKRTGWA